MQIEKKKNILIKNLGIVAITGIPIGTVAAFPPVTATRGYYTAPR